MGDTTCFVLGLKKYQNTEIECINKIINNGYSELAVAPNVPIFLNFKTQGISNKAKDIPAVVRYCTMADRVVCEFGEEDVIIDINDSTYCNNLIPGWFGNVDTGCYVGGEKVLYANIDLDYRTSNQRLMPVTLAQALSRFIAYNLLGDVFKEVTKMTISEIKASEDNTNGHDANLVTKVNFCVSMLEAYISAVMLSRCKLGKYLDLTLKYNNERSAHAINAISGISKFSSNDFNTPFDCVWNVMHFVIDSSVASGSEKISILPYFESTDAIKIRAMEDRMGVKDKKNKTVETLRKLGKLDDYLEAYYKYFNCCREIAVERVRTLEEQANIFFNHVFSKKKFTEQDIDNFYAAVVDCSDLLGIKTRPEKLNKLLSKVSEIEISANESSVGALVNIMDKTATLSSIGVLNTSFLNTDRKQ